MWLSQVSLTILEGWNEGKDIGTEEEDEEAMD